MKKVKLTGTLAAPFVGYKTEALTVGVVVITVVVVVIGIAVVVARAVVKVVGVVVIGSLVTVPLLKLATQISVPSKQM